jgi:hypothetical protein
MLCFRASWIKRTSPSNRAFHPRSAMATPTKKSALQMQDEWDASTVKKRKAENSSTVEKLVSQKLRDNT